MIDTSRMSIVSKYTRYYPKVINGIFYVYILSRLINVFSLKDSFKIISKYFRSFYGFKMSMNKIKKFKPFMNYTIEEINSLIDSYKDFDFKSQKFHKRKIFYIHLSDEKQKEIDKLHNRELYEHYCDIREIKTGYRDTFSNPEVVKNIIQTNIKKYGVRSTGQLDWVIKKQQETNIEKYGVKSQLCIKENRNSSLNSKIKEINTYPCFEPDKDYLETFITEDGFDIKKCAKALKTYEETVQKLKKKYKINVKNIQYTLQTQRKIFKNIKVQNKFLNFRLNKKELDIYIPDYNLAIEYDGLMYHSEGNSERPMFKNKEKSYHLKKTELCLENNIQLFHIFEGEDLDLWLSMINSKLGLNNKIFARKCIIKELKSKETEEFLNHNHLQGFCQAKINVGLFYEDELVSVMTFSKPRFNKKYEYELIRFVSKRNYTVVGGASRLWKYFVNKYNPNSVITYANRRFSNGEIYKVLNFKYIGYTQPNYFYFKINENILYSRVKFQKHKLKDILDVYDEDLSEAENMFNNDYRRIYDCGNLKFEWIKI